LNLNDIAENNLKNALVGLRDAGQVPIHYRIVQQSLFLVKVKTLIILLAEPLYSTSLSFSALAKEWCSNNCSFFEKEWRNLPQ
jgi:hypothetical protein